MDINPIIWADGDVFPAGVGSVVGVAIRVEATWELVSRRLVVGTRFESGVRIDEGVGTVNGGRSLELPLVPPLQL